MSPAVKFAPSPVPTVIVPLVVLIEAIVPELALAPFFDTRSPERNTDTSQLRVIVSEATLRTL